MIASLIGQLPQFGKRLGQFSQAQPVFGAFYPHCLIEWQGHGFRKRSQPGGKGCAARHASVLQPFPIS